jgi:hypothetical protein
LPGGAAKSASRTGVINLDELAPRDLRDVGRESLGNTPPVMDCLSKLTFEALDHKRPRITP